MTIFLQQDPTPIKFNFQKFHASLQSEMPNQYVFVNFHGVHSSKTSGFYIPHCREQQKISVVLPILLQQSLYSRPFFGLGK
jgi:hypothetical protein